MWKVIMPCVTETFDSVAYGAETWLFVESVIFWNAGFQTGWKDADDR